MRFICWLWEGKAFWKRVAKYNSSHVTTLANMLQRHGGHKLTCVTDCPRDVSSFIETVQMPRAVSSLPDYLPKLWAFSPELHAIVGERFASIDLDVVITGDLAPILLTRHPFRIWNKAAQERYNSSLFSIEPGFGNQVWQKLTAADVAKAKEWAGYWTGDQSWISYVLGAGQPTFGEGDGVIQYRPAIHRRKMPSGAKASFMCGPYEPLSEAKESAWVKAAYH